MKKLFKFFFKKIGLTVESNWSVQQGERLSKIIEDLFLHKHIEQFSEQGASIICFSKDRPLQLDGLLNSMSSYISEFNELSIKVLYFASDESFKSGYEELSKLSQYSHIQFQEEKNFRTDFIELLSKIKSKKVLFLVDDLFFKAPLNWTEFTAIDTLKYIPSLRHGNHLTYAYTVQKKQKTPLLTNKDKMLRWKWTDGEFDWAYPLSVDGHLFNTYEILTICKHLDFKAPNSLEESMQVLKDLFSKRDGLCYPLSIIVNNPANIVQEENENFHGELDNSELNKEWLAGLRFDYSAYNALQNSSAHELLDINLIKDERR